MAGSRRDRPVTYYDMIRAAPLSPIIRLLALVLADVMRGITEASVWTVLREATQGSPCSELVRERKPIEGSDHLSLCEVDDGARRWTSAQAC